MKGSLLQLAKQEFCSGFGKITKEDSSFILLKYQLKKHWLKQYSYQIHHKQYQEQN